MKQVHIQEIISCLPQGKTLFPYFRDRYAAMLLPWLVADGSTLASVKQGRYASLLNKEPVRTALAHCGDGHLRHEHLEYAWAEPHEQFLLTLDQWGGDARSWQQTSRSGYNLVLQVNLHDGYRKTFEKLVGDTCRYWFSHCGHPVMQRKADGLLRQTLGWIRIDLDFATGEALIEEIQTDWLRDARAANRFYQRRHQNAVQGIRSKNMQQYCGFVLDRLGPIWDEALLSAAIEFIRKELGIRTIWYHTHAAGCQLKRISMTPPPKSLYTRLPKRFCFDLTYDAPLFLQQEHSFRRTWRKLGKLQWYRLQLI